MTLRRRRKRAANSTLTTHYRVTRSRTKRQKPPIEFKDTTDTCKVLKKRKIIVEPIQVKVVKKEFTKEEKIEMLRQFDLDYKYGPSQDLTRLERWNRANNLKLEPSPLIQEIILSDSEKYLQPLWNEYSLLCTELMPEEE